MKSCILLALFILKTGIANGQNRYAVVIDEIMADPTPTIGLPNNEWIELKNTSGTAINLQGWRIGDRSSQSGAMPGFRLQPDSFVIICSGGAAPALAGFGAVITVTGFPSLDNESDQLFLKASSGLIVHAVEYSSSWYRNELKKQGGWSLEMIDPANPCSGYSNWKASTDTKGGTPGQLNSIQAVNNDSDAPVLQNAYTTDSSTIVLVYNEPVDSTSGASLTNYSIDGRITFIEAVTLAPLFNQVQLKTDHPLQTTSVYKVVASHVMDCKGNAITVSQSIQTGIPADPGPGEMVINEILFNPRPNGYDYVEFYNKSTRLFNAQNLFVANRNSSNVISSMFPLISSPFYIFPGDHIVITEDAGNLALNYLVKDPHAVLTPASLPSFPDDKGSVLLLNSQGSITDEVKYDKNWHFKLLNNDEGVALERIDPLGLSQDAANWHSAASTAGYGTPGYKNSQYRDLPAIAVTIDVTPPVFSPDNDGLNDIATIQYKTGEPGYIANVIIFDAAGRLVKNLANNSLLGNAGYWNWDGLSNDGQRLPTGIYVVFTEVFNLQGKKKQFKNTIILGRKLR